MTPDRLRELADEATPGPWRAEDIPGEKCQNHEFEIHSLAGRIVGARLADGDTS